MKLLWAGVALSTVLLSSTAYAQTSTSTAASASQSQSQSGSVAVANPDASNQGNTQTVAPTFNSYTPATQTVRTAPPVAAPALTTTLTETCMGSTSVGVSVIGWGATGGTTWEDHECVRRLNARELAQTLGDREAAREVLCGNGDVFRVYNALGRPCRLTPAGAPNPAWAPPPPPPPPPPPEPVVAPPPPPPPPTTTAAPVGERGFRQIDQGQ
jgi:hypothetical protein